MQHISTVQSSRHARGLAVGMDEPDTLMRGVLHGLLLSMVVWTAAIYVTLVLR